MALLRRDGREVNAKRVQRVRRAEGLQVRERQERMRRLGVSSGGRQRADGLNAVWSWDFVEDQTENGTRFRILTLIDEYTRRCLAIHVGWSIRAVDVIAVVEAVMECGRVFARRAGAHCVCDRRLAQSRSGGNDQHPSRRTVGERLDRKLRDACLNRELFGSLHEVQMILEQWGMQDNEERPHGSLGYQTPAEYAVEPTNRVDVGYAPPHPSPLAAGGVRGTKARQTTANQNINELAEL